MHTASPRLTLAADGTSDTPRFLWSGEMLFDIEQRVALKMTPKSLNGTDYLFIESGGFNPKNPAGWKTTYSVFKK